MQVLLGGLGNLGSCRGSGYGGISKPQGALRASENGHRGSLTEFSQHSIFIANNELIALD